MTMRTLLVTCLAVTPLAAQQHLVVPQSLARTDGPSLVGLAGVTVPKHQQFVVDAAHLQALQLRSITGIRFRRDQEFGKALVAGQANLTIRIGQSPWGASRASSVLARNLPSSVEVYRGTLDIPAAPPVSGALGFDPPDAIQIRFSAPYPYAGGDLCIDLVGVPLAATRWPVDAASDPARGSVTSFGVACGRYASIVGETALVAPRELIPGRTVRFVGRGEPGSAAFLLFGLSALSQSVDLAFLGAPGCSLHVSSFATAATTYGPAEIGPAFGGLANVLIHIPGDPALLGARFVTQWFEVGPTLASSNAHDCRISSALPSLGMATVTEIGARGEGYVDVATAPVIRFDYQ
jgi:hypothetical protein